MKPTPELIYEYRMSRERAEREAVERREAACTAIPRLREIADQRRLRHRPYDNAGGGLV